MTYLESDIMSRLMLDAHRMFAAKESFDGRISMSRIISAVAAFYHVTEIDILSRCTSMELSKPRHVAMYLSRRMTTNSLSQIGRRFNRDIWTGNYGYRKIEAALRTDEKLRAEIDAIKGALQQ